MAKLGTQLSSDSPYLETDDEAGLRVIRGSIDTSGAGSIVAGSGFSITRNGTGDVTVNFDVAFGAVPTPTSDAEAAGESRITRCHSRDTDFARFIRFESTLGTAQDGVFHFTVIGPAA